MSTIHDSLEHPILDADGHWAELGHFDVPDMGEVVPEAYELVEHGLLTDDDFRDFIFVDEQAAEVLARGR